MKNIVIAFIVITIIGVLMSMTGRGGGNFYVPVLVGLGLKMHQAAAAGQFILLLCAASALLIFQKNKIIDWKLALIIDPPTDLMAFFGGYYSHLFVGKTLKFVFAGLLVVASIFMLFPVKDKNKKQKGIGIWNRTFGEYNYFVNLWVAIPICAATGFVSGMVGISGGSFKIPLMVIACGVPMRIAVGTSSAMVALTALMGLIGHSLKGDFNVQWALPVAIAAVIGGLIGSKFSIRTKPENLKKIFAATTMLAAFFMFYSAFMTK